ncbi:MULTISPECIES: hypothetical protein [unclassified Nostoc]|uniref:hypothetical protein n=1 Tax=unclassified Nostoc TaxID=2593658 RepID=UPI002AD402E4|nr:MULTISPECIES: hypothetical protein [unclassified Nostoc]MDZ7949590.1 hypothetical protein [Nostoc sp. DedQUE09]
MNSSKKRYIYSYIYISHHCLIRELGDLNLCSFTNPICVKEKIIGSLIVKKAIALSH